MREILFRGKRKDNGEWVEGCLLYDTEQNEAFIEEYFEDRCAYIRAVDPETVGQFTGLTANGTKIFEGDIVISHSRSVDENDGPAQIEWDEDTARFIIVWNTLLADFDNFYSHDLEVVGNIHDNPELIECEV